MKNSFGYLIREGFRNAWVNRLMSFASVAVLASCLTIIGVSIMAFANIDMLLQKVEDQNVIMVFAEDNVTAEQVEKIGSDIQQIPNVKEVIFQPREEAFKEQMQSLGSEAAIITDVIENPLPDSYKVVIEDLGRQAEVSEKLKGIENVSSIRENSDLAEKISQIRNIITLVSLVIIAMLFLVAFFIISNTIRITMFSRRLEISIMKAVGATNSFIRLPFMIEGVVLGVVASAFSTALVYGIYEAAMGTFSAMLGSMGGALVPFTDYFHIIISIFLAIGAITGIGGSAVSMGKYLREKGCVVCED